MGAVESLAETYAELSGVRGFDWSGMRTQGRTFDGGSYINDLQQADWAASAVIFEGGLGLEHQLSTASVSSGRAAITAAYRSLSQSSTAIYDAIKNGQLTLAADKAMNMPLDSFKMMLATTAIFALNGADLHYSGAYQDAVRLGKITLRDAEEHASQLVKIFRTIKHIDIEGGFDELKPGAQSGVGAAPLVIPGWVVGTLVFIVGVLTLTGMAALYSYVQQANKTQERVGRLCEEQIAAHAAGSPERMEMIASCSQAMSEMQNANMVALWKPLTSAMTTVAMFGGIGLLAWMTVRFVAPAGIDLATSRRN